MDVDDKEDIIDEVLNYFRANVLFRNFEVKGGADRTLIYLTLHVVQCLVKCERIEDKPAALRELRALSTKQFALPGDATGWPLGGMFPTPANKAEGDAFRAYFKQAREEVCIRLCDRLFDADGTKNKWWQVSFHSRIMYNDMIISFGAYMLFFASLSPRRDSWERSSETNFQYNLCIILVT